MGLVQKFSLTERVGSFVIKDITGVGAPYGYSATTVLPSMVTSAVCYVTPPGALAPVTIPQTIFSTANIGNDIETQIHPWDMGLTKIESGKWIVKIVIEGTDATGSPFTYGNNKTYPAVFTKEVECCVDKETGKVDSTRFDDVFRDEKSRKVAMMSVLLTRAQKAIGCDTLERAERIITFLKLQCRCGCG